MTDMEKVIKGFECCHVMVYDMGPDQSSCGICPYKDAQTQEQIDLGGIECIAALHDDALALLKEQEARVMTLDEVKAFDWDYCYLEEERLPGREYRAVCGDHKLTCITWPCVTSMQIQYGDESYGKKWRCWSAKPTEKQRHAGKWDD